MLIGAGKEHVRGATTTRVPVRYFLKSSQSHPTTILLQNC